MRANVLGPIRTNRLLLRPLDVQDAPNYHALETDPEVKQFLDAPSKRSVEHYRSAIATTAAGLNTTLAVTLIDTGSFVGRCGFTEYTEYAEPLGWEINIVLHRQYWKQGYASEIGLALISRGFSVLACEKFLGVVDEGNIPSIRLCERLQMKLERKTTRYGRSARIYAIRKNA